MQRLAVLLGDELFLDADERMKRQLPLGRLDGAQDVRRGETTFAARSMPCSVWNLMDRRA